MTTRQPEGSIKLKLGDKTETVAPETLRALAQKIGKVIIVDGGLTACGKRPCCEKIALVALE
jgi:hypothetical protein